MAGGRKATGSPQPLWRESRFTAPYIVQLAHRLQGMGERGRPLLDELAQELARRGTTIDDYIQRQHARRSASNLVARNIITSLRALTSFEWRSLFESTSRVELLLRTQSTYVNCDRRTRDRYRNCIEEFARTTHRHEVTVTQQILELLGIARAMNPLDADLGSWLLGPRRADPGSGTALLSFNHAPFPAVADTTCARALSGGHWCAYAVVCRPGHVCGSRLAGTRIPFSRRTGIAGAVPRARNWPSVCSTGSG